MDPNAQNPNPAAPNTGMQTPPPQVNPEPTVPTTPPQPAPTPEPAPVAGPEPAVTEPAAPVEQPVVPGVNPTDQPAA